MPKRNNCEITILHQNNIKKQQQQKQWEEIFIPTENNKSGFPLDMQNNFFEINSHNFFLNHTKKSTVITERLSPTNPPR